MEQVLNFFKNISPKTWIIIAIVALLIIALIIYLKNKSIEDDGNVSMGKTVASNVSSSTPRSNFPLQYGSKGEEVKAIQLYLNSKGEKLLIDGIWGPLTETSIAKIIKLKTISEVDYKALVSVPKTAV